LHRHQLHWTVRLQRAAEHRRIEWFERCGAARCASGSLISPRRSSSTSALLQLTSFAQPSPPIQSSQPQTRRDRALRARSGSATAARMRSMLCSLRQRRYG
jgi:hypothetical protein